MSKAPSIPDLAREDRIEHLAGCIVDTALVEAMTLRVGPRLILEALSRVQKVVERMAYLNESDQLTPDRLNELRAWLGMVQVPTAVATAEPIARPEAKRA